MQARQNLKIMANISTWAPHAFFFGDFRKRLSAMMNYFLSQIITPKLIDLKYGKKKEGDLKYKAKSFLRDIIKIYVNLSEDQEFCKSITQDERSYNPENMKKALKKAQSNNNVDEDKLEKFESIVSRIQEISKENEDIMSKLGDIPEEFMCPISCDLMKDPVYIPTSGKIMEKSVAKQILLNDEHDPFNRAPLKFSQVQEQPELKKKIEDWIRKKLSGEIMQEEKPKVNTKPKQEHAEEEKMIDEAEEGDDVYDPFRWTGAKFH